MSIIEEFELVKEGGPAGMDSYINIISVERCGQEPARNLSNKARFSKVHIRPRKAAAASSVAHVFYLLIHD
jgi:hypothetical protein